MGLEGVWVYALLDALEEDRQQVGGSCVCVCLWGGGGRALGGCSGCARGEAALRPRPPQRPATPLPPPSRKQLIAAMHGKQGEVAGLAAANDALQERLDAQQQRLELLVQQAQQQQQRLAQRA